MKKMAFLFIAFAFFAGVNVAKCEVLVPDTNTVNISERIIPQPATVQTDMKVNFKPVNSHQKAETEKKEKCPKNGCIADEKVASEKCCKKCACNKDCPCTSEGCVCNKEHRCSKGCTCNKKHKAAKAKKGKNQEPMPITEE